APAARGRRLEYRNTRVERLGLDVEARLVGMPGASGEPRAHRLHRRIDEMHCYAGAELARARKVLPPIAAEKEAVVQDDIGIAAQQLRCGAPDELAKGIDAPRVLGIPDGGELVVAEGRDQPVVERHERSVV